MLYRKRHLRHRLHGYAMVTHISHMKFYIYLLFQSLFIFFLVALFSSSGALKIENDKMILIKYDFYKIFFAKYFSKEIHRNTYLYLQMLCTALIKKLNTWGKPCFI